MFGTLRPRMCGLSREGADTYRQLYCGLCAALGRLFGQPSRLALSHDATVLAAVADGLMEEPGEATTCRCPARLFRRRPVVAASSPAVRSAAAVQMVLAQGWLIDQAADRGRLWRLPARLFERPARRAAAELDQLGLDASLLVGLQGDQLAAEDDDDTSPSAASAPSARAIESVLGQLPNLPGTTAEARTPGARHSLRELGRSVGLVVYLVDALRDLAQDLARGGFNPCLVPAPNGRFEASAGRVETCRALLEQALASIRSATEAIPWQRHRNLLANVLTQRLPALSTRHGELALAFASGQPPPPPPPPIVPPGSGSSYPGTTPIEPGNEAPKKKKRKLVDRDRGHWFCCYCGDCCICPPFADGDAGCCDCSDGCDCPCDCCDACDCPCDC